jgi:predicted  nucleic acid-binding Zn-ribbon protein
MEKLSVSRKLAIVRHYLSGLSYDEIAAKSGVSKGTVSNVVTEFKAGRFPEAADAAEHIEQLRELSLDLRRLKLTPAQCAIGFTLLNRISECGLDPADIDRWPVILRSVPNQDEAQEFIRLVYSIQEVQKRSGLSLDALESKAHELERKAVGLEPSLAKLEDTKKQLAELTKKREELASTVAHLEEQHRLLDPRVKDLEKREQDLSRRVRDMEPKALKAETTLFTLNSEMQRLQDIGLPLEALAEFNQGLQAVAHRHNIKPAELRSRLLHEMETLDKGLGLEALVQSRQEELDKINEAITGAKNEADTATAVIGGLEQEKTKLEAGIKETREKVSREMAKISPLARAEIGKLVEELRRGHNEAVAEVHRLRDEALAVGKEVGRYQEMLQTNQWLSDLLTLVRGEEDIEGRKVRAIVLSVVRGMAIWLERHDSQSLALSSLSCATDSLIRKLEQWKV